MTNTDDSAALLAIDDLSVHFDTPSGEVIAVDHVALRIDKGQTVALVGESGSGKSVTALSVMQLLPYPRARHPNGSILFRGEELVNGSADTLRRVRGDQIGMIFQEPMTSLNPLHTVRKQISETLLLHKGLSESSARERCLELLEMVRIEQPEKRLDSYPHQLSGGQRQRVMIAMALANDPDLLIADEPTTALDVTTQAQILDLMLALQQEYGMALLFITHDLGVVAEIADEVAVMYLGKIVERADADTVFNYPKHPYTQALLRSIPKIAMKREELDPIKGMVPNPFRRPDGCNFNPRCPYAMNVCREQVPVISHINANHTVSCWLYEQDAVTKKAGA
jgi:peptide/nickel transport system ATP-binding protein